MLLLRCMLLCLSAASHHDDARQPWDRFARIDPEKCIDCGLCVRTCHFKGPKLQAPVATYAAQRVSKEKISLSASGGTFAVMAEHIINSGGTVFGCAMPKDNSGNFSPEIVECDSMDRLNDLLGSKYLFSDTGSSYRRVRTLLNQGKTVFYSGLPCQIGGLLGYLRHPYPNLITIDIICHGAPVAPIFNSYIRHLESSKKSQSTTSVSGSKTRAGAFIIIIIIQIATETDSTNALNTSIRSTIVFSCPEQSTDPAASDVPMPGHSA